MLLEMIGGGLLRFAPEVLKFFDRKNERNHELAMLDKSTQADRVRVEMQMALAETQGEANFNAANIQALIAATRAQSQRTGIRWVDAISAIIRPTVTLCYFGLYAGVRIASIILMANAGATPTEIVQAAWTAPDMELWGSILTFWFVDRTYRKMK